MQKKAQPRLSTWCLVLHGDWSIGRCLGKIFHIARLPCRLAAVGHQVASPDPYPLLPGSGLPLFDSIFLALKLQIMAKTGALIDIDSHLELAQFANELDVAKHLALGHGARVEVLVDLDAAAGRDGRRPLLHLQGKSSMQL